MVCQNNTIEGIRILVVVRGRAVRWAADPYEYGQKGYVDPDDVEILGMNDIDPAAEFTEDDEALFDEAMDEIEENAPDAYQAWMLAYDEDAILEHARLMRIEHDIDARMDSRR